MPRRGGKPFVIPAKIYIVFAALKDHILRLYLENIRKKCITVYMLVHRVEHNAAHIALAHFFISFKRFNYVIIRVVQGYAYIEELIVISKPAFRLFFWRTNISRRPVAEMSGNLRASPNFFIQLTVDPYCFGCFVNMNLKLFLIFKAGGLCMRAQVKYGIKQQTKYSDAKYVHKSHVNIMKSFSKSNPSLH